MATCKSKVRQLLNDYTYYAVLNEVRASARVEGAEGKALAVALFEALRLAEAVDDTMEPEGVDADDEDEGEEELEDDEPTRG